MTTASKHLDVGYCYLRYQPSNRGLYFTLGARTVRACSCLQVGRDVFGVGRARNRLAHSVNKDLIHMPIEPPADSSEEPVGKCVFPFGFFWWYLRDASNGQSISWNIDFCSKIASKSPATGRATTITEYKIQPVRATGGFPLSAKLGN